MFKLSTPTNKQNKTKAKQTNLSLHSHHKICEKVNVNNLCQSKVFEDTFAHVTCNLEANCRRQVPKNGLVQALQKSSELVFSSLLFRFLILTSYPCAEALKRW